MQRGPVDDRTRQGHALFHAATQVDGHLLLLAVERNHVERLAHGFGEARRVAFPALAQTGKPRCPRRSWSRTTRRAGTGCRPCPAHRRELAFPQPDDVRGPRRRISPASGRIRPMTCLRNTLLPPPERPMMTVVRPLATSRSTPRRISCGPIRLVRPRTSRNGGAARVIGAQPSSPTRPVGKKMFRNIVRKKFDTRIASEPATTASVAARPTPTAPSFVLATPRSSSRTRSAARTLNPLNNPMPTSR